MEKLSSGYRINRAADDAAGLAISEKMRGQIGGLAQAQRNAQDGISLVQTAEGALTEVHSMLQRVRDLKVQYDNGTLATADRSAIESEVLEIAKEVATIVSDTKFNGTSLFDKNFTFQVGANTGETISIGAATLSAAIGAAGVTGGLGELTALSAGTAGDRLRRSVRRGRASAASRSIDKTDRERVACPCQLRRGAEPPRAPSGQPGDLPGEPDGVRVAHP